MSQCRYWCFTSYKTVNDLPAFNDIPHFKYTVYQVEQCPSTTRVHIQGYIEFTRSVRLAKVKQLFNDNSLHLEPRRGTAEQARDYCTKEESRIDGPYEVGTWEPQSQGKRTDLLEVQQKLKDGVSMKRIADEHFGSWCRYEKSFKKYKKMVTEEQRVQRTFNVTPQDLSKPLLIIGPTGCGKTAYALSHFTNPLLVSQIDDLQLLENDHDGIVFDDMRFDHWPPETVIHLLDIEYTRSIHNRFTNAQIPAGTKRIFTHNLRDIFYSYTISPEQKAAIDRRFNVYNVTGTLF